jgi:predicted acyltransferase
MATDAPSSIGKSPSASRRVVSIDALRGFDMFWIMGGDAFFIALLGLVSRPWASKLAEQLEHVDWQGFHFYDLIFPLFLFVVGCAIPYSLEKYRSHPSQVFWRIARRTLLLVLMGLIYNRIQDFQWESLRWMGVLQRIGICYGVAALLYVNVHWRWLVVIFAAILLGYWGILIWVPVPGGAAGDLSPAGNLAGYLDRTLLPGKILEKYYGYGDNEGLLSTIPAIATALLGVFAGIWLKSGVNEWLKVLGLAAAGGICLGTGVAWGEVFPVVKNLWTSSFVLVSGGWSLLLLAVFYLIIDVIGWRSWAWIWVVIGANAITIYMVQHLIDFEELSRYFLSGIAGWSGQYQNLVILGGVLALKWALLIFLVRNKIFLRL